MFSQKYKNEIMDDLFESMDQLDRIEFQNRIIQQNQNRNISKNIQSTFLLVNFISMSFLIYFSGTYVHLLSLGFYSEIHRQSGLFFFVMFIISTIVFITIVFDSMMKSDRTKKENDEQLDFILSKK